MELSRPSELRGTLVCEVFLRVCERGYELLSRLAGGHLQGEVRSERLIVAAVETSLATLIDI